MVEHDGESHGMGWDDPDTGSLITRDNDCTSSSHTASSHFGRIAFSTTFMTAEAR